MLRGKYQSFIEAGLTFQQGNSSCVRTSWMLFPAPFNESASLFAFIPLKARFFNQSQWRISCARLVPDSEYSGGGQHRGTGTQPAESASQLPVPPARVPAEAGADAHHGDDDDRDQSQSVPRVVRLHRADKREKDEPHDCCGIWKFKFGSHVAAVSSSGSAASESDDAQGEQTSGSAQPITVQLYSSRACRMFSFSSYKTGIVDLKWDFIPLNLKVSDEINVKQPVKPIERRAVTLLPCVFLMCPANTADTSVSLINSPCLQPHVPSEDKRVLTCFNGKMVRWGQIRRGERHRLTRLGNTLMHIFHLFSSDRERITSLLDLRITLVPLKHISCLKSVMLQWKIRVISCLCQEIGLQKRGIGGGITGFVSPCLFSWNCLVVI